MSNDMLKGKYLIKNKANGTMTDVTTLFNGVRILMVSGLSALGETKNVYTSDWEYETAEDMAIVMQDSTDTVGIVRENVDIQVTFCVRQKYADRQIDVGIVHDNFVKYMTDTDVWVKSMYDGGKTVHCICLKGYEPTAKKLNRGESSYAMGTITLHCLDKPSV